MSEASEELLGVCSKRDLRGGVVRIRFAKKRVLIACGIVLVLLGAAFAWYINDCYRCDNVALAAIADSDGTADGVVVRQQADGTVAFVAENPVAGMVFYPGAKVQPEAYAPLLTQCAREGVTCVLVKPLFNLAVLDVQAAESAFGQFPELDRWILAGHSMGGVAAGDFAAQHSGAADAVVFLAAYANVDLASYDGKVLCIYGSDDGVLNRGAYENAKGKLPPGAEEIVIDGGNHAYFGNYGEQGGDGAASITREEQQETAARALGRLAKTSF